MLNLLILLILCSILAAAIIAVAVVKAILAVLYWFIMPIIIFTSDARLHHMEAILAQIESRLEAHIHKETATMSALTDAVATLTATAQASHQELVQVLTAVRDFPAKVQAAIDQALANGATPEALAGIKAANDGIAADTQSMIDALATPVAIEPAPAPAPVTGVDATTFS